MDCIVNSAEFEKGLRADGEAKGRWRKSKMTPASFLVAVPLCCLLPHSGVVPSSHFCGQEALLELNFLGHEDWIGHEVASLYDKPDVHWLLRVNRPRQDGECSRQLLLCNKLPPNLAGRKVCSLGSRLWAGVECIGCSWRTALRIKSSKGEEGTVLQFSPIWSNRVLEPEWPLRVAPNWAGMTWLLYQRCTNLRVFQIQVATCFVVVQSLSHFLTLCYPMDCSTSASSVLQCLLEFA